MSLDKTNALNMMSRNIHPGNDDSDNDPGVVSVVILSHGTIIQPVSQKRSLFKI
jgi:hypothetical protein